MAASSLNHGIEPKDNNILYAQAGGVSAVINTSAAAVLETVAEYPNVFGKRYVALDGIEGVLEENLLDIDQQEPALLDTLKHQPAAAFQSCRFDLAALEKDESQYQRILAVFKQYQIGYFFYNGGNGSMVTAKRVADYCAKHGHPVICIGVAKTIDNDLDLSHCSPGFGSAAKYLATSFLEATLDVYSMHRSSTKCFIMETMGRNAGWLTMAAGLIKDVIPDVPLILLPAERAFDAERFIKRAQLLVEQKGFCVIAVSEGIKDENDRYLNIADIEHTKAHDYTQLGGAASQLAQLVKSKLGYKTHYAIPDYFQRSASHMVSEADWQLAYGAGKAAVEAAVKGEHGVLPVVQCISHTPFQWRYKTESLMEIADLEKRVPDTFISADGMDITPSGLAYLRPLIQGEHKIPYQNGLPNIPILHFKLVEKQLPFYKAEK